MTRADGVRVGVPAGEVDCKPVVASLEDVAIDRGCGAVVGDEDVHPAVAVVVGADDAASLARMADAQRLAALSEDAVAVGHEEPRRALVERGDLPLLAVCVLDVCAEPAVGEEQIPVAVVVEVGEAGSPAPTAFAPAVAWSRWRWCCRCWPSWPSPSLLRSRPCCTAASTTRRSWSANDRTSGKFAEELNRGLPGTSSVVKATARKMRRVADEELQADGTALLLAAYLECNAPADQILNRRRAARSFRPASWRDLLAATPRGLVHQAGRYSQQSHQNAIRRTRLPEYSTSPEPTPCIWRPPCSVARSQR